MAKRTRGSNRPGQRHQDRSTASRPQTRPTARPNQGLSAEEEARAAELESQIVAQDRVATVNRTRARDIGRSSEPVGRARSGGLLAARAAEEYGYVARDVRRIIQVGALMLVFLAVAWVLIDLMKVVKI